VAKKTYIVIPILRAISGGGAEKDNCSAETEKIGAENAKNESAEKSAETATDEFIDMLILALEIFLIRTCYFYVSDQF